MRLRTKRPNNKAGGCPALARLACSSEALPQRAVAWRRRVTRSGSFPVTRDSCRVSCSVSGGFTLVELLMVIAIISMLAALFWPTAGQVLGRMRAAQCVNNLHQLGVAIQLYAQENNQKFPAIEPLPSKPIISDAPLPSLHDALLKYAGNNEKVFHCPRDMVRWSVEGASYEWCYPYNNDLVDAPQAWIFSRPIEKATILWDYDNVHRDQGSSKTKNVLYADGHIQGI